MIRTTIARAFALLAAVGAPVAAHAQALDICGCTSGPSLGAFDSRNQDTWPPGTVQSNEDITIPLPPDGVLVFDSLSIDLTPGNVFWARLRFSNAANTPVTLLSRGNVLVAGFASIVVNGGNAERATSNTFSVPGVGGPGGYAGGRGSHFALDQSTVGGAGIGPAGGAGGAPTPSGGSLLSVPELRPLRGGSGGGGGGNSAAAGCAGGAGGGGAGAILIASNATIFVDANAAIRANGGAGSNRLGFACDAGGAGGGGGAIRLVANAISGTGRIEALGGSEGGLSNAGLPGVIRMESFTNTFGTSVSPVAARLSSPGPLVNPFQPQVAITAVQGVATPVNPIGYRNEIDLILPQPGTVELDVETRDVPAGTDVEIVVKPRLGAAPTTQRITLAPSDCTNGVCTVDASFDLAPGTYIAEARATFEVP
jgi:hypothetical protein